MSEKTSEKDVEVSGPQASQSATETPETASEATAAVASSETNQTVPTPAAEADSEPVTQADPEPVVEPDPAPVVEPDAEPAVEAAPAPAAEPDPAPVAEPDPAPVAEPEPAPVVEATAESVAEPDPAPVVEPTAESVAKPDSAPMAAVEEPDPAPAPETAVAPIIDAEEADPSPAQEAAAVVEAAALAPTPAEGAPLAVDGEAAAVAPRSRPAAVPEPAPESAPSPASKARLKASFNARTTKEGDVVVGKLVKITGSIAFVDYGARSEGYIELSELRGPDGELMHQPGDEIEVQVIATRGAVQLSYKKAQVNRAIDALRVAWKSQTPVSGKVIAVNKGGYEIRVDGVRGFCPASQMAERFIREQAREVGKTYEFRITEFHERKGLVLSRRVLLEAQREHMKSTLGERIRPGQRLQGRVTQLADFGAFVDLGDGIEGMIHVSEISHGRIDHPRQRFSEGDAVEVEVIRVEAERGRVALSTKRLESDPWTDFVTNLKVGAALKGTVVRFQEFGAFVTLAQGVDGLLHVSAITSERRIEHPSAVLEMGTEIDVIVEKIDHERKRVGLVTPEVAEARKPVDIGLKVGQVCKGKVSRVERYGVFLEIAPRVVGLIPNAEMATDRGTDHLRKFPVGTELEVKVVEIEKGRNRIRLSRKALLNNDEEQAFRDYRKEEKAPKSLGTFGDLLKDFLDK